jgi:anhydro-N-acetylmuramic acid kinase
MNSALLKIQDRPTHRVIGLMSGTSADGVDAALCELSGEGRGGLTVKLVAEHTEPYPDFVREKVLRASDPRGGTAAEICELHYLLGEVFAASANQLMQTAGVQPADVDLIGSHGQTISHIPPRTEGSVYQLGATLQLGEAAVIAERTGINVISNFRARDIAAGGQGAPLVPFVDYLMFSSDAVSRVALNIGGISNVTWLPAGGKSNDTLAYDSGPGNMIIDAMVQYMTQGNESYDRDGDIAASGTIHRAMLTEMMRHPYVKRVPPKSTGREEFGFDYAMKMFDFGNKLGAMPRDIVATATEFTALTIAESIKQFVQPRGTIDEIIVSGGGALNPVLMDLLNRELPKIKIETSDKFGLPLKAKESIAFAILARESALGRPSNMPTATGAQGPRVLGQFTPA